MDVNYNEVYSLIPSNTAERIKTIIANALPEENLVCVVHYTSEVGDNVENMVSIIQKHGLIAHRIFLPCKETEFAKATKFILIMDALSPIVQSVSSFFDYFAELPAISQNLVVLLSNTASVPSPTEVKRNVRVVMEKKGLEARIFTEDETDTAIQIVIEMGVDVEEYKKQMQEKAKLIAVNALSDILQSANEDLQMQKDIKTSFLERQSNMSIYGKQLKLDMWLMIQNYCDKQLENDVRSFAKQMMPELEKMIHDVDLHRMHYYFPSYLNYLWGQFLTNEVDLMMDQLKGDISAKIEELLSTYRNYFSEEAKLGELEPITIKAGAQPISFDVEHYNYTLNKLFDMIVGGLIRYKFLVYGDILTGGRIGNLITNYINKKLEIILRIKYSNKKILNMYSEVIYKQFFENVDDMIVQLRDYMIPALEKNFKESVQDIIDSLVNNMESVGQRLDQRIEHAMQYLNRVQKTFDSIR